MIDETFPHLVIDGGDCVELELRDRSRVQWFLEVLPERIGMTKIVEPMIYPNGDSGGFSGIVIIAESHISVHTHPAERRIHIDLFSCKAYDVDEALREVRTFYSIGELRHRTVFRGYGHFAPDRAHSVLEYERGP